MKPKMICDDCFHKDVCRLDGNEILEWCSAMVSSADVAEVVRCKDCKYRHTGLCAMNDGYNDWATDEAFCSCGAVQI